MQDNGVRNSSRHHWHVPGAAMNPHESFSFDSLSRRDLLRVGATGLLAASAGGVLAACGGSTGSSGAGTHNTAFSSGPAASGTPVKGGALKVGLVSNGASETIDVRLLVATNDYARSDQLYDPLFFLAPNTVSRSGYSPGLAVSGEPNADATVWTLRLRRDVEWHDGKSFTADDVIYTINSSWFSPKSGWLPVAKALIDRSRVRKLDAHTVVIPLKRGLAGFPLVLAWFNAYVVQDGTDFRRAVGTGPFKFEAFTPGVQSTFVANPNYWGGAPHIDRLIINSSFRS